MGTLLSMYAQAGGSLEGEVAEQKEEINTLQEQLTNERNAERREQIRKAMAIAQAKINVAKQKMKQLLEGAAETASKAAVSLGDNAQIATEQFNQGAKVVGAKLSSGLASLKSSIGKKLSSGIKSISDKVKSHYDEYNERQLVNKAFRARQEAKKAQDKANQAKALAQNTLEKYSIDTDDTSSRSISDDETF